VTIAIVNHKTTFIIILLKRDISTACGGGLKYIHLRPESRRRRRKGNPAHGGITGPPCHWGDINVETWSSGFEVGRKADDLPMYKNYCSEVEKSENEMQSGGIF
jgi:hypothetical protein